MSKTGIVDSSNNVFGLSGNGVVSLTSRASNPNDETVFDYTNILSPLNQDKGVVFPYTPTLQVGHQANYGTYDITHTIYQPQYYISTSNPTISITANFTANDIKEAEYTCAAIQFFKTATKSDFGESRPTTAGTPPPILNLKVYDKNPLHARATPVVVRSMNYTMPEDVNYVECQYGTVPTMMLLALELSVQHSPATVRKNFNISEFSSGSLLNGGFN